MKAGGFLNLHEIVPATAGPFRINKNDFRSNSIVMDTAQVQHIEASLIDKVCMLVAPKNRGKTFTAKLIGLRSLQVKNAHACYASIVDLNVAEATDYIISNNKHTGGDTYLFIVDDCHVDPSKSNRLFDSLSAFAPRTAHVLLTSRPLKEVTQPFRDVHKIIEISPSVELVSELVERHNPSTPPENRRDAMKKPGD